MTKWEDKRFRKTKKNDQQQHQTKFNRKNKEHHFCQSKNKHTEECLTLKILCYECFKSSEYIFDSSLLFALSANETNRLNKTDYKHILFRYMLEMNVGQL